MKCDSGAIVIDPERELQRSCEKAEITQLGDFEVQWQTPGLYLAQKIVHNPLVRFIGEIIQSDYIQVIVVVDDDAEELIDKIFSLEQEMYQKFHKLKFDLRLRVMSADEDIELIKTTTINRYDRLLFVPK